MVRVYKTGSAEDYTMASEKVDRDPFDETSEARLFDSKYRLGDVSAFQRDLLAASGQLEQDCETVTTSGMIEILAPHYSAEITRGRLSRNPDDLNRRGMIDRKPLDGRTNEYPLTDLGREVLRTAVTLTAPLFDELRAQQ
jgi:hypothetical protein